MLPTRRSSRAIALLLPSLLAASCWLHHDPEPSLAPSDPSTPGASTSRTADPEAPDAGSWDAGAEPDASAPGNPCAIGAPCEAFAVTCDPNPIDGVPCCTEVRACIEGRISSSVTCDDDCAQWCELVWGSADCLTFGCAWFVGGCVDEREPDFYYGPGCIPPPGELCDGDDACPAGEVCQVYWVNPCPDGDCQYCGAPESRCTVPLQHRG